MTVSATLDKTVRLYRANFKPLLVIAAIAGALQLPFGLALGLASNPNRLAGRSLSDAAVMSSLSMALVSLISLLAWPLFYGALGSGAFNAVRGQPISVGQAFRVAFSRYFSLLGAGVLIGICTTVATLLLIVPGFYVFLGLSLTMLVIIDESLGAVAGMRRSWGLADGKRWFILGIMFAWGILHLVLTYGVSSLLRMFGLDAAAGPLAQQLSQILIVPCYGLSLVLLLEEVRTAREGRDLVQEAQRLAHGAGGNTIAPPQPPATL
jgi:hypothetical protein